MVPPARVSPGPGTFHWPFCGPSPGTDGLTPFIIHIQISCGEGPLPPAAQFQTREDFSTRTPMFTFENMILNKKGPLSLCRGPSLPLKRAPNAQKNLFKLCHQLRLRVITLGQRQSDHYYRMISTQNALKIILINSYTRISEKTDHTTLLWRHPGLWRHVQLPGAAPEHDIGLKAEEVVDWLEEFLGPMVVSLLPHVHHHCPHVLWRHLIETDHYRTPPHVPVPDAITATEPVEWTGDNRPLQANCR
ncbi:hypothetical protein AVEN_165535-1 [Araneus ventricosus]|uniref:Uncharacterized protein n=1 Tax=Araneus ventricosus TaxID=182803 RepID=A0A4Y2UIB6_ARAVE|nr:hypothetical protein AVEN_9028-1 [Araneus ventricosus]GBO12624.1 hypothetical protein AVEN_165535-1 [Araneus ventricosus]